MANHAPASGGPFARPRHCVKSSHRWESVPTGGMTANRWGTLRQHVPCWSEAQEYHLRLHVAAADVALPLGHDLQEVEEGLWIVQPVVKIAPGTTAKVNRIAAEQKTDYARSRAARKWAKTEQFLAHTYGLSRWH